ncbi:MAG: glutathione S-transferase family protein [Alphaproteobacteria bacterium]|nr:glutathione S-transferase family protein [Alphaproteobacteria bacterium]
MADLKIYLGNKNYSSWSLRGWLMVKATGAAFEEEVIPLNERETRETILKYSPSGRVPVLHHGNRRIWDTLAIGEYLNEQMPEALLWPADVNARRLARSVAAEMHSGFAALRANMPMNIRRSAPGKGMTPDVQQDINRINAIWRDSRQWMVENKPKGDEGFLFGTFSIADAMYAPVVTRFVTYAVDVDESCRTYMETVLALPAMKEWSKAAGDEPQIIEEEEV